MILPAITPPVGTWEAAAGLSRTRFAELLYEHEGFVDHAYGEHAPDRDVPVWIDDALASEHIGDCTGHPSSCMTCHAQMALDQADEFVEMMRRATQETR